MPTLETSDKLKKKRLLQKQAAEREARILGKSKAITPSLMAEMAQLFDSSLTPNESEELAEILATEHQCFENAKSPSELEEFSHQTVVGIGQHKKRGYILVLNELKVLGDGVPGLGFPGGRVRLGETPINRLKKEFLEETGLCCEVLPNQLPVAEHKVGEEEHKFSAYKINITSGKPQASPTKDEPISAIIFLDEETLKAACKNDGCIRVKVGKQERIVGVLRNHRLAFMEYLRKRDAAKPVALKEVAGV
jgi:ADP-ribose pyrophosphatase YjhB (NUDIX family)